MLPYPVCHPQPDLKVYAFLQRAAALASKESIENGKHYTVNFPDAKQYQTADKFFADKDIDPVLVCTQHDTHAEFGERALANGKHGM
jgi:predicted dehydrogenase